MTSCFRRAALGLRALAALAALLVAPTAAEAHGRLKSSAPAAKARLAAAPREIRLVFTEAPELTFTTAALVGPNGPVALGPVAPTPGERMGVAAPIRGALVAGSYTVNWQTAGADGHPVRGTYAFVIEPNATGLAGADAPGTTPPAAGTPVGEAGAAVPVPGVEPVPATHHDPESMPMGGAFDAESPAYVAVRWLQFTALLLVLGALAFNFATLGFLRRSRGPDAPVMEDARRRAAAIGLAAAVAVVPIALARLYAQSYAMHGGGSALEVERMSAMLGRTSWGVAWIIQVVGAVLAMVGFSIARRSRPAGWSLAALGAVTLAVTPALSGHAAAAPKWTSAAILADTIHVIGAGGWLGGLLLLVAAGIPAAMRLSEAERGPAVADLVNAFSPTALLFAGAAGATGVFAGWLHMGAVSDLWRSDYGRMLLLKLGILSVVAGTGAYNWLRVRPALGDLEGARRIRRSASVELAVGVLVLAVTAVLVAMPTPMDSSMMNDPAMDHSGMDMSSMTPVAAPAAAAIASPNAAAPAASPARDEDQHFLRDLADHYEGMTYLSHAVMEREASGPLKDRALALDGAHDAERQRVADALARLYQDRHVASVRPQDRAAADSVLRLSGPALADAFGRRTVESHRRTVAMIDQFLPRLARPEVVTLARELRASQQRGLAALGGS